MKAAAASVAQEVQALERVDLEGLRAAWRARVGPPPKVRSPELLRLSLAWRIQAAAYGGLDTAARRRLRDGVAIGKTDHVVVGARIIKEWRGRTYTVDRVADGYRWDGQIYPSLSAAAQAITGVKRNGPSFFGLREAEGI